jgi:hypothetical protein
MISDVPEIDAHSPEELRKAMWMCGSEAMSSVLPDSVLVWKMRLMPFSYVCVSIEIFTGTS